jgi:hypothetical protein
MKKIIFVFLIQSLLVSCGFFGSRNNESEKISVIISVGQAGDFSIGQNIDDIILTNDQTTTSVEVPVGEGEFETRIFLKDNNLDLVKFSVNEQKKITEIEVLSPLYKTAEGIGIGSTLATLMTKYPDIQIWHTYVSGRFIAETKILKNVQFFLDPNSFTGDTGQLYNSDIVNLSSDQFTIDARVIAVRIF